MSLWTGATDELVQYLAEREALKRQKMLDDIAAQERQQRAEDRQRRIERENVLAGQHDLQFEQEQRDRAERLKAESIAKQQADTQERLGAMRQASLNVAGTGDPTGAQATRNAINVALRLAGGGEAADKAQTADVTREQTAAKQRDVDAYNANPTPANARVLETRWGIKPTKPEIRELNRNNRLVRVDDEGAKVLVGALPPEEGGSGGSGPVGRGSTVFDKDGTVGGMTPGAIEVAAKRYNSTGGELPTRISERQKTAIMNKAYELDPNANPAFNRATLRADSSSLNKLQTQADQIDSFEDTALANLQVLISKAPAIFDSGSPFLNTPLRKLANAAAGSPEQAAYNTARRVVIPEFTKLLNNVGGSAGGQVTDTARREMEDIIHESATIGQIASASDVLRADAANRRASVHRKIKQVRERIRTGKSPDDDEDTGDERGGTGRGGGSTNTGGMVKIITPPPNSREMMIPADKLDEALKRGAKRAAGQ